VLVSSRSPEELESLATSIRGKGGEVHTHVADVTDLASIQQLGANARALLGPVSILVNSAGVSSSAPIHRLELSEWNKIFAVNATGTFLCTQAFLPDMVESGWGRVVNVASVAGLAGSSYIAAYSASKHAVIGFTRSVAAEMATRGVTVNAVCPGYVDTDMTRLSVDRIVEATGRHRDEVLATIVAASPLKRLIKPDEVAHVVVSLCAEDARATNGQAIVVDGGQF
jgi:NAD(P)-dependent dehydrogenase (short-subunit alcohol dehydrogenase family)